MSSGRKTAISSTPRLPSPPPAPPDARRRTRDVPETNICPSLLTTADRPSKKARHGEGRGEFAPPCNGNAHLRKDLAAFGFTSHQVTEMMSREEATWDPAMPQHLAEAVKAAEAKRDRLSARKDKLAYEPLFLNSKSNWVVFDPKKDFPAHFGDAPHLFQKLATFKLGNTRIVEYNIHTQSVRMRTAPRPLDLKRIRYGPTGPRVVEAAGRRGLGRPRHTTSSLNTSGNGNAKKTGMGGRDTERAASIGTGENKDNIAEKRRHASGSDSDLTDSGISDDCD